MRSLVFKQIYFYNQYFWVCGLSTPEAKCTILYQNLTTNLFSPTKHLRFSQTCAATLIPAL